MMATVEHICGLQQRSLSAFHQVLELEKAIGAPESQAVFRAMCASLEQFERELIAIYEAEQCEE